MGIHAQDVPHDDVVVDDAELTSVADDHFGVRFVQASGEPHEGKLLPIIDSRRDQNDDQHGREDGGTLEPAVSARLPRGLVDADGRLDDDADDPQDDEHDQHEVLHGLPAQFEEGIELLGGDGIGPERLPAEIDVRFVVRDPLLGLGA